MYILNIIDDYECWYNCTNDENENDIVHFKFLLLGVPSIIPLLRFISFYILTMLKPLISQQLNKGLFFVPKSSC